MVPTLFYYVFDLIILGYEHLGMFKGYEMMCSDSANGVVGRDKCTGVFNCRYFCDGDLCNLAPGLVAKAGIHSANLILVLSLSIFGKIISTM